MRLLLTVAAILAIAWPAAAWDDMKRMQTANALGDVLAGEEMCGLAYDPDKVSAFIEKTVPADDMQFPGMLNMMTEGAKVQSQGMSASSKAAHCAQIKRVAKSYGFTG